MKARSVRNAALPMSPTSPLSGLKHSHSASNLSMPNMPAKLPLSLRHRYSSSTFLPMQDETSPVLVQQRERGERADREHAARVPLIGPVPSPTTVKKRRSRGLSLRLLHHHTSENRVPKYAVREFSQFLASHAHAPHADRDQPAPVHDKCPSGSSSSACTARSGASVGSSDSAWADACAMYLSREKHCFSSRSVEDIVECECRAFDSIPDCRQTFDCVCAVFIYRA